MKIEIDIPEGYEVDTENSTKECIKLKKIENKLPKTWEEFCNITRKKAGESLVKHDCRIVEIETTAGSLRDVEENRNLLPSREYAEAMLALCQLIQLRDCYNDGWKPDWNNEREKYTIEVVRNVPGVYHTSTISRILTFKSQEIRDTFFRNFKDLIKTAKPLL